MKKIYLIIVGVLMFCLTGCNKQILDLNYTYKEVYCNYDGKELDFNIKQWKDYDGEQLQVKDYEGNVYLISANKCYLKG